MTGQIGARAGAKAIVRRHIFLALDVFITVTDVFMAPRSQKAACLADVNPVGRVIEYSPAHD